MNWLQSLGWSDFFERAWRESAFDEGAVPARVIEEQKGLWRVLAQGGEVWGELPGKLRHGAETAAQWPAVGDWIALKPRFTEGRGTILGVLARRSRFSRRAAGEIEQEQIVATNIDTAFIVTSLNAELNLRRLERYLTLVWESGATPVILLTKSDLVPAWVEKCREVEAVASGVLVRAVSAKANQGLEVFKERLTTGKTGVLLGSSGVGKSTLVNWLFGQALQTTQEIRAEDSKGRHTTTSRRLFQIPGGGLVIDTPGMRELQMWEGAEGIDTAFDDIAEIATQCRFRDCQHEKEPGCAVRGALADGRLDESRFTNYLKLSREIAFQNRKYDKPALAEEKARTRRLSKAMYRHLDSKKKP